MGFETHIKLVETSQYEHYEAIPMGFETIVLLMTVKLSWIMKLSLWDLES